MAAININATSMDAKTFCDNYEAIAKAMARDFGTGNAKERREKALLLTEIASHKPLDSPLTAKMLDWAIEADPECSEAHFWRGRAALAAKDWDKAIDEFERTVDLDPTNPAAIVNMAVARDRGGDPAVVDAEQAIDADHTYAPAYLQLFGLYERAGRYDEAASILEQGLRACAHQDGLLFARATLRLREGDYQRGWADYEHRPGPVKLRALMDEYEEWDGAPLNGKTILIARDQGFGDEIMFARYLPLLAELGLGECKIILHTYPELARLFAGIPGVTKVVTADQDLVEFDCWTTLGSLPYRTIRESAAIWKPYLSSSQDFAFHFPKTGNLRVGLAWAGNPEHAQDRFRSIPFDALRPLLGIPGIDFYSLQINDVGESGLTNLRAYCHDWADMAAAINNLDLVISCDTGVGHLAGAIGKPCWVLLGQPNDWRWGKESASTPWYPNHTLIRGKEPAEWGDVVECVARKLNELVDLNIALGPVKAKPSELSPSVEPMQLEQQPQQQNKSNAHVEDAVVHSSIITRACRYGEMSFHANDTYIGRALDQYLEYSEGECELFRRILKLGDVVIDAGANIGTMTVPIAQIVGSGGMVLAWEPQDRYYDLLWKNTKALSNALSCKNALGSCPGSVTLQDIPTDKIHAPGWKGTGVEIMVEQLTIDSLRLKCCHFIKIDVDGQELEILKGAEQTIDRCRPIIYTEYDKPEQYPDMLSWLVSKGYRLYLHEPRLFNPQNFAGNPVNVFGSTVSRMVLAIPNKRKDLRQDNLNLPLTRLRN